MARVPVNQPYQITTRFGVPDSNALFGKHSGIDYAVPLNRPVYAPVSGDLYNEVSKTGGNMVRIFDGKYWHRLMHNNSFVRGEGRVSEGDEIAKAGTTGLSTGVHVHWDVATKRVPTSFSDFIDPNSIIKVEEDMPATATDIKRLYRGMLGRPPSDEEIRVHTGTKLNDLIRIIMDSEERRDYALRVEAALAGDDSEAVKKLKEIKKVLGD